MFRRVKKEFSNILGFFTKKEEQDLDNLLSEFKEEVFFDCFMESLQLSNELLNGEYDPLYGAGSKYIEMSGNGRLIINKPYGRISLEKFKKPIYKNHQYNTISYWRNKMTFTPIYPDKIKPCIVVDPMTHPKFQKYKSQEKIKNILEKFNNLEDINNLESSLTELNQKSYLNIRGNHKRYEASDNNYNYWGDYDKEQLICSGDNYGISSCTILLSSGEKISLNEYKYLRNHPEMWAFK